MVSEQLTSKAVNVSWNALKKGQELANSGEGYAEIIKVIPDSAQILFNKNSLLFFIEGSVPMLITRPSKSNQISKGSGTPASNHMTLASTAMVLTPNTETPNVVAFEHGEEKRQHKKALVFSAYLDQFQQHDDAIPAIKTLRRHHNYFEGIQHEYFIDDLSPYKVWDEFDLVHVSSHGILFCGESILNSTILALDEFDYTDDDESIATIEEEYDESGYEFTEEEAESDYYDQSCKTVLETGIRHQLDEMSEQERLDYLNTFRTDIAFIVVSEKVIGLKASFFQHYYPTVENKVWVFSACEMGQYSDMQETMRVIHKNGHFLYWQNIVDAKDAHPAFQKFYKNLIVEGLHVKRAYEKIPEKLRTDLESTFKIEGVNGGEEFKTTTSLLHVQTGNPKHGIEVVQLLHPVEENVLEKGAKYPLEGDFSDGQPETLVVKLDLLGYTQAEFQERGMTLTLKVDDLTVLDHFSFLPDDPNDAVNIKRIPGKEYGLRLHFEGLEIPDLSEEKETIELKAYLHFNDEDFSIHSEVVSINPKDVRIRANNKGRLLTITYDKDTGGLKFEAAHIPGGHTFSDDQGYMYVNKPNQGWKKLNLNNFMGQNMTHMMGQMMPIPMEVDLFLGREGISSKTPDIPNGKGIFKPMVDWPERMTISVLSRNPNFEKHQMECLDSKGNYCVAFMGIQGAAAGVQIYFNTSGKLQRIVMKDHQLDFEYGDYTIVLPNAEELKLPF